MMAGYSIPELVTAAGQDPWDLARAVTDAQPDTVRHLGMLFTRREADALAVARDGARADAALAAGHIVDGRPVFDAAASAGKGRSLLSDDGATMTATGAVFTAAADDLTAAQTEAQRRLQDTTDGINAVIAQRNAFFAAARGLITEDATAAEREFQGLAVDQIRQGVARIETVLGDYDARVGQHAARLEGLPLPPPQAPPPAPTPPPPTPAQQAGAVLAGMVNDVASFGNAVLHDPLAAVGLAGGAVLTGVSALGVAAGGLATATGIGAPEGIPLAGVSAAGVATGVAMMGLSGAALVTAARGADRVTPMDNPFGDTIGAAAAPTMIDALGNAWDTNGKWEKVVGAIPQGEGITHTPRSNTHIPYGEHYADGGVSGGHMAGSGIPNATVFPDEWEEQEILERALDVARNPDQVPTINPRTGNWEVLGTREGIEIEVVLRPDGTIITARPIRGPGVTVNDENGDPGPPPGD